MLKDMNEMFADDLRDPAYTAGYLNISLEDDGVEGFLYALQKVARAHGISRVASASDMPRESLYRSLSDKGNPGIKPLSRVMESLGLRLTVTPTAQESSAVQPVDNQAPTEPQEGRQRSPSLEEEIKALHLGVEEEIAALCREARAEREAMRRAMLVMQEETHRSLAQIQHLTTVMAEQVRQAEGRNERGYRVPAEPTPPYTFSTRTGKQQAVSTEPYQQSPLKLVKVAS